MALGGRRTKADKDFRAAALRTAGDVLVGSRPVLDALRDCLPPGFDADAMPGHEHVSGGGSRWHTFLMALTVPVDPATLLVAYPYSGAAWFPLDGLPTATHEAVGQALECFGLTASRPSPEQSAGHGGVLAFGACPRLEETVDRPPFGRKCSTTPQPSRKQCRLFAPRRRRSTRGMP